MLTSSRNQFKGTVKLIKKGAVNDEIIIKLAGGTELAAIITSTSTDNLKLAVGTEAIALVKATWVILATDLNGIKLSARNTLKGTVRFLSDNVSEPVIKLNESLASVKKLVDIFRLKR